MAMLPLAFAAAALYLAGGLCLLVALARWVTGRRAKPWLVAGLLLTFPFALGALYFELAGPVRPAGAD